MEPRIETDNTRRTWRDIEEAAVRDPLLRGTVAIVERGELTREEALIACVLTFSRIVEDMAEKEVRRLQRATDAVQR